jgi:predicted nucleic acid-binding Zn ribbon protein
VAEKPNTKHQTPNTNKGPENLGDILGRLFTSRGWGRKNDRVRLETAWKAAAAEFLADTSVLGLKRGVLEIAVRNAVLLQELTQFHKRGLLTKLRAALPGVTLTDLKFRAAAW